MDSVLSKNLAADSDGLNTSLSLKVAFCFTKSAEILVQSYDSTAVDTDFLSMDSM